MTITRYEPINVLAEINRLFDNSMKNKNLSDESNIDTSEWVPAVDIKEDAHQFAIYADLPGIDKKDVEIAMHNNTLTIKGERKHEHKESGANYFRVERVRGSFYRRFSLPDTADGQSIRANMQKGVLEIIIPKIEKAKPRTIDIQADH